MSRLVFNDMKKEKWGRIINLTSLTAKEPEVGMILSNVTRAAISSFSKTLSKEIGQFGITVNTILTGGVLTERSRNLINLEIKETGESYDEAISRIVSTIPIKRIATPEEFSKFITFLASIIIYINGTSKVWMVEVQLVFLMFVFARDKSILEEKKELSMLKLPEELIKSLLNEGSLFFKARIKN